MPSLPAPTTDFDRLAAELAAEELAADPVHASALGVSEHDEELPDLSARAVAERQRREDGWLERFAALPDEGLAADERIDRDLVLMVLRGRQVVRDWADWRRSADTYAGAALQGVFVLLLNRLRPEPELARAVAARLRATPALLEQGAANLDPGLASPELLRRALGQVAAGAAYARTLAAEFADEAARREVAEAGAVAAEAFERFGAVVEDLAGRAGGGWAIGEERYDALLRQAEGLSYGTRELRDRGRAAYADLLSDIRARTRALRGGDGSDWRGLLEELNEDRPETPGEMLELYRRATAAARQFCVDRELVTLPAGEQCAVVPSAPFTRPMVAVAHYQAPPPFGTSGVGHFFVPYPPDAASAEEVAQRLATNNRHGLWSITAHEAYPGHHWHLAHVAAGAGTADARPGGRVLRTLFASTYFTEGWGLYSEDLMREQGFFTTPQQELCQRDYRLFRAARIVVDTSLHLGEMTVEQAVEHLTTRTSLTPGTARAEVLRYCARPTQASSYLTGALEIARLRERWLAEGHGSLREFHDAAAGSGTLPVSLVERSLFG